MGRTAAGVRAIRIGKGDRVVGGVVLRKSGTTILVATEHGYGKRSETGEYRVSHRGGKGIITVKTTDKTGPMVSIREVVDTDDVVVVTSNGIVIRQEASEIRVAGRNTQGVRLIRLGEGDKISDVAAVASEENEVQNGSKPAADPKREPPAAKKPEAPKKNGPPPANQRSESPKGNKGKAEAAKPAPAEKKGKKRPKR